MCRINLSSNGAYLWVAMLLFLFSCREDSPNFPDDKVSAWFIPGLSGTEPASRAVDNRWTAGDPVGICMLEKSRVSDDYPLASPSGFKRYKAKEGGENTSLESAAADQTIYYPVTGEVRFVAFCPYTETTTISDAYEVTYTGFADQSFGAAGVTTRMEKVDFLYCAKTDALYSKFHPTVDLTFRHRFSKLVVQLETSGEADADRVDISRLDMTVSNLPGSATVSLEDGEIKETGDLLTEDVKPCVMVQNTSFYESHAIVVPHQSISAPVITFRLAGDQVFTYAMREGHGFNPGFFTLMKFKLTRKGIILTDSRIVNWINNAALWKDNYMLAADPLVEFGEEGGENCVLYIKSNCPEEKAGDISVAYSSGDTGPVPSWLSGRSEVAFVRSEAGHNVYSLTYNVDGHTAVNDTRTGYVYIDYGWVRLPVEIRQRGLSKKVEHVSNCYVLFPGDSCVYIPVSRANEFDPNAIGASDKLSASLIWSDNGADLVAFKSIGNGPDGIIRVTSNPNPDKVGNAVVAVWVNGQIKWSWHIWVTRDDPDNPAHWKSLNGYSLMDRNLGATNIIKGDPGSLGVYYQWGRKDPFPGPASAVANIISDVYDGVNALTDKSFVISNRYGGQRTMAETVSEPYRFIYYNGAWTVDASIGDDFWEAESMLAKNIYNPCPGNWRVPVPAVWSDLEATNFPWTDLPTPGRNHATAGWFPACGFLDSLSGTLYAVGVLGYYWTAPTKDEVVSSDLYFNETEVYTVFGNYRGSGFPIRCVHKK